MKPPTLFTIGYAGHTPESLFDRLRIAGVKSLIDVRELPLSRKKGFSKSALAAAAAERSVEYRHFKALGVPSAMRHRLREGGIDAEGYMNSFRELLRERPEALEEALSLALAQPCCLLCLEASPAECHRTVVADEISRIAPTGLTIVEL